LTSSDNRTEIPGTGGMLRAIAILSASALTLFALAAVAPSLPAIERAYADVPDAALLTRMVLTITALFIALSAPVSGFLLDRIGRKPVLLSALVLYLFSGTAGIWLEGLNEILVSRAILGVAAGMILTSATTLIGDFYQGDARNRMAGIQVSVMVLAVATGTTIAGYLADTDWRLPFYLYALSLVVIPLVFFGIREPARTGSVEKGPSVLAPHYRASLWRAGFVYLLIWISMVSTFVIPSQTPFLLPEIGIPAAFVAGLAIALFNAVAALTAIFFRHLRDRFDNHVILAGSYVFLGIGLLLAASADNIPQAMLGMVFAGIGFGPLMPTLFAWLLAIAPPALRGRLVGGLTFFQFLGLFASPLYSQPIAGRIDMTGAFAVTGLAQIALGLAFIGAAISTVFWAGMRKHD
jgi:MFS family permease